MSKIRTVLFDLDGTLLPMDQKQFVHAYFHSLYAALEPFGFTKEAFQKAMWGSVGAAIQNDGATTNEEAFWRAFQTFTGIEPKAVLPVIEGYYRREFQEVSKSCGYTPYAKQTVERLRKKGRAAVLATNPVFPRAATESRIRWAGLSPEDFLLYTTYESCHYCKPNLKYYREILERLDLQPQECLMVGNDVEEDMIAEKLGMQVFLLTDCLINRSGADIARYPHGGFRDLQRFLDETVLA
ncbi:MAG TPA: HAD family hydrolase [Candidatus Fimenecus excrementigallinarum]|uniref:HAD family hydrolase n=1 Tax=Candidatus Fimenecus excrementigallinarum TaxID=2840816 RepID=A0A9D1IDV9_9FIRM|nr:HAD family hydrolase [Candidatus Fimenecus excrementigallinarum]